MLFDADGVVQHSTAWERSPVSVEVLQEIFTLEAPMLRGAGDFPALIRDVVRRNGLTLPVSAILALWRDLTVDAEVLALVEEIRQPCYLATNQQHYRTDFMRATLGYDEVFDDQFYSCEIGFAKPEPQYFQTVLGVLNHPAEEILLIDDSAANITAARECGLSAELHDPTSGAAGVHRILRRHGLLS